ncbi:Putative enoyl-CoA hydratase [Glycine soja]|nr:Putative enoyl-CoA hydratase [Glycine soja]
MDGQSPEKLILVKRESNGVALVMINRPGSLNSLTRPMMVDLAQAFKRLDRDESRPGGANGALKPIIGAIRGFAVTAGFEIALACDILVAAKGSKFMDTHARFGIFLSWGLSQKLSQIIGANKAREGNCADAIVKTNQDLVLRYKAVINDGLKLDLGRALSLEKERAHDYYNGMTKEQFRKMQEFIAGRSSKKQSKL